MKINKIIKDRRSVREYRNKKVDKHIVENLLKELEDKNRLKEDIKVNFGYMENGEEVYEKLDGLVGYYGKVIKAPHYIYITCKAQEGYLEASGYLGERFVLKAAELGLGTCWIEVSENIDEVKKILGIKEDWDIIGLLTVGYSKREPKIAGMYSNKGRSISPLTEFGYPNIDIEYTNKPVSERISIENIAYLKEWGLRATIQDLEDRSMDEVFYYMRLAPSWGNRQPWRFIIDGERIILVVRNDEGISERIARIEAGIAMLYFELMTHKAGIPGGWVLEKPQKQYNLPEEFFIAGFYKM